MNCICPPLRFNPYSAERNSVSVMFHHSAPPFSSYTVFSFAQQLWSRCDCLLKLVKALFSSSNHFQANNLVLNSGNVETNSGLFMPNKEGKYALGVANDVESKVIKIPFSVLLIITYIWLAGGLCLGGGGWLHISKSFLQARFPKT